MQWSVESLFQLVQTAAILLGIPIMAFRLGRGTQAVEASITTQGLIVQNLVVEVRELKDEQKEMRGVLIQVAQQKERLDNQGSQIALVQREIADLRRGDGFILPPRDRGD